MSGDRQTARFVQKPDVYREMSEFRASLFSARTAERGVAVSWGMTKRRARNARREMQVVRNVRSTGPLWAVKTGYIVVSVLFCVLGAVLLVMSERCVPWIGRALGIGMVVCGAIKLGGYFSKDLFRLAFQYDLAFGSLLIAVGIIALCHPGEAMSFLCVMFGIPVLADGLFKIQIAVDARRFGIPQWWLVLALAVLTGVIGLLLVLRPTEGAQALVMLMGVSLLLDGALNLSVALCAVKVVRHQQPDIIETDDFEIE